ncbi:YfcC family protein [Candidatus Enterococcus ferrettii]|uniref:C4-dicarboxylate anaerobic carrier n=1 Tax=Candidatus Enterococcus ferrettii TaxID=2815324 RepID=A0ABV0EUJ5_9ENTE|nr:YfcC family protein [Enterococcus sp. 665A]MBO1339492.1 YfcC family protein [Enterococcus sp. 665A]
MQENSVTSKERKKKTFKMPGAYTVLFIIILVMTILTWLIPAGKYDIDANGNLIAGTYQRVTSNPQGIWDAFKAPIIGMIGNDKTAGAIPVSLFILIIGGFLGVVNETKVLDIGIATIIKKNKGRETKVMILLLILFALGGTSYGMFEESIAFLPLIIPVMLGAGFDVLTGISIVFLGVSAGILASTVNPFSVGVASATAGISPGDGLNWRLVLLVIVLLITITFVHRYAMKVKNDPGQSLLHNQRPEEAFIAKSYTTEIIPMNKNQKMILILFVLTFVIMILGLIPWTDINPSFTFFNSLSTSIKNVPLLGNLLGSDLPPLGTWYFVEMSTLFFMMTLVIGRVNHMNESEIMDSFFVGLKDLVTVAMVVAVARGIQVVMNEGQITATILHFGEIHLSGLSPVAFTLMTYLFYIPMAFLIPSTSGLASATIGILTPLGEFIGVSSSVVIMAYQCASGIVYLVTPTSAVLVGSLAIGKVEYSIWLKYIWKYVLIIFLVTCLVLIAMTSFRR